LNYTIVFPCVANHFKHLFCVYRKYFIVVVFLLSQDTFEVKNLATNMRIYNTINTTFYVIYTSFYEFLPKGVFFYCKAKK